MLFHQGGQGRLVTGKVVASGIGCGRPTSMPNCRATTGHKFCQTSTSPARGTFAASFMLAVLAALELETVTLANI